jgi:hypothetical protein
VDSLPENVERFTIRIDQAPVANGRAGAGRLVMEWGTFRWSAPLVARPHAPSALWRRGRTLDERGSTR